MLHSSYSFLVGEKRGATKLWKDKMEESRPARRRTIICPFLWTDIGYKSCSAYHIYSYFPLSWRAHLWAATRQLYFPVLPFSYIQSEQLPKMGKHKPPCPQEPNPSLLLRAFKSTNVGSCGQQRNKQHHLLTEHHQEQVTGGKYPPSSQGRHRMGIRFRRCKLFAEHHYSSKQSFWSKLRDDYESTGSEISWNIFLLLNKLLH